MKAVSGKEIARILKRRGWSHTRSRGSHQTFQKPGHLPITIPVHGNRTLKTGMQRFIMKSAGLTEGDL
jgi:predicted RNA binding protein YcfA (HicA-like mRNA interferase family)